MLAKKYAQALYDLVKDKDHKEQNIIFGNFIGLLNREGHSRILSDILKNFEILNGENPDKIILATADEDSVKKYKKEVENYKEYIGSGDVEIKTDDSLIGGFKIRTKNIIIDGSYKRSLRNLYSKFTTN